MKISEPGSLWPQSVAGQPPEGLLADALDYLLRSFNYEEFYGQPVRPVSILSAANLPNPRRCCYAQLGTDWSGYHSGQRSVQGNFWAVHQPLAVTVFTEDSCRIYKACLSPT